MRRSSSFGFMGRFGRSADLRMLDAAMRAADLHPALVPEGVKLAAVNLMKDAFAAEPPETAYPPVGQLMSYCLLGAGLFERANGADALDRVERRMDRAIAAGEGLDAELVLLALHAKLVHPEVVEEYRLEAQTR